MFDESFRHARTVATILLLSSLTSCALPPREAWRIIQTRGLVAYINGEYGPTTPQSRYLAYGAPLQTQASQPSQVMPLGYRSRDYRGARYLPQYQQPRAVQPPPVMMPPPRTIVPYSPPQQFVPVPAPLAAAPQMGPPPPRISTPAPPVRRSTPPPVKRETAPAKPKSDSVAGKTMPLTPPASTAIDDLPYGTAIPGRPGMVNSPYAQKQQLVDVTGMGVGQAVKCPYTGKLFRVPPTQQAGATPQSTEPKVKAGESGTKPPPSR